MQKKSDKIQELILDSAWGAVIEQNNLFIDPYPSDLDEDISLVLMPGGYAIDIGWYKDTYCVTMTRDAQWNNPIFQEDAPTPAEAAAKLREFAERAAQFFKPTKHYQWRH